MSAHTPRGLTRRASLRLAAGAAGAVGLGALGAGSATAAPAPQAPRRGSCLPLRPGATAFVTVQAATAWVEPDKNRPGIDDPSLTDPTNLDAWNANMEETEPRRWLTGKLETQAVLGSKVIVDEIRGNWAKVVVTAQPTPRDDRGYPGWMPVDQLAVDPFFELLTQTAPTATVTAKKAVLSRTPSGRRQMMTISFDTVLPVIGSTGRYVRVAVPGGRLGYLKPADVLLLRPGQEPPAATAADVLATGKRFLDLRYLWAGVSSYGYDCSGFTYTMYRHHGVTIARDAGPQRDNSGLTPVEREDLQPGDLVFFSDGAGSESIRHVAMYAGEGKILHAPNAARSVEIISLEEYDVDGEYAGARRVIEA